MVAAALKSAVPSLLTHLCSRWICGFTVICHDVRSTTTYYVNRQCRYVAVLGRVQLPVISTRAASVLSYVVHAVPCSMCRASQPRCILLVSC